MCRIGKTCIASNSTRSSFKKGGLKLLSDKLVELIQFEDIRSCKNETEFTQLLNVYTDQLCYNLIDFKLKDLWGLCRKAINLYLRDCYYNKFVHDAYQLNQIASYLETPIDSFAMNKLKAIKSNLQKTPLYLLNAQSHEIWQIAASEFAIQNGLPNRVDADLEIY